MNTPSPETVLPSQLAGSWYAADPARLTRDLQTWMRDAGSPSTDPIGALLIPHAGYQFSGAIAARAVGLLRDRHFDRIIVMAPSHRMALTERVALPAADAMATPLGQMPIDRDAVRTLAQIEGFTVQPAAFDGEHSIEIQLPLLQHALGRFSLVPLVVGQLTADTAERLGRALLPVITPKTLVVVSSDFTHYGDAFGFKPFGEPVADNIRQLDDGAFDYITQRDAAGFLAYCDRTGATICGRYPIAMLLAMLPDDADIRRIAYTTSGHLTGDFSHCVSYLAAACTLPGGWPADSRSPTPTTTTTTDFPALDTRECRQLLALARRVIEEHLKSGHLPALSDLAIKRSPGLMTHRGAFVTLQGPDHQLRGCIGEIEPRRPLLEAVADNAIRSAFHDPRFPPMTVAEWPAISIEISALTPPRRIDLIEAIEIGRHGIILEKDGRAAVFLPQVAVEQGWDRDQTLTYLSKKAGLASDAWRQGATFSVFEAQVFNEPSNRL